jgi:cytochrome c
MPDMRSLTALLVCMFAVAGASCDARGPQMHIANGDPARGETAIRQYGCASCHTIAGIRGSRATVGPPLEDYAQRVYVAGVLPNNADNLIRWITDPPGVDPLTAMPNLGVSEATARDIASFLYAH